MYLRIKYESFSQFPITNVLLFAASCLPEDDHAEAVAIDGLRVIFQTLEEATARLETKLINIKTEIHQPPTGGMLSMHTQACYTSIIGEVWIIIDNIRRIHLLLKLIPGVPHLNTNNPFMKMINEVKELRDSLHHINERIDTFYSNNTEPVLGQIMWRDRTSLTSVEECNMLYSGVQRVNGRGITADFGNIDDSSFIGRIGVYDLRIRYVIARRDPIIKGRTPGSLIDVNIENAVTQVNELIVFIYNKYVQLYHSLTLSEAQLSASLWPLILTARLKSDNE